MSLLETMYRDVPVREIGPAKTGNSSIHIQTHHISMSNTIQIGIVRYIMTC